ncbi:DUF1015 domain-containing protein [Jatrophihabitans sp. DSM 45814]
MSIADNPDRTQAAPPSKGLSLTPFRATRYTNPDATLGLQLSPPYDVISPEVRASLIDGSETNAVRLILPGDAESALADGDPYAGAEMLIEAWIEDGTLAVDDVEALFVYEMSTPQGDVTRGLLGAIELRDPDDGVILPHENTMAGPVSDRLALMTATDANLEPIYLVYDGGGAASSLVADTPSTPPVAQARTSDGVTHRLWALTDPAQHAAVSDDLSGRRALIADGHHRYATYRQLQADHGGLPGPWDRGLTLLVDTSAYGPQVHAIHRVVALGWDQIVAMTRQVATLGAPIPIDQVEDVLADIDGFAVALVHGAEARVVSDVKPDVISHGLGSESGTALGRLDVTILHRVLVEQVWGLTDSVETVDYAHDIDDAIAAADASGGTAVLLRATPVQAVAEVAAAGARMPRKSTLFTPKPASGLVLRRFADQ